MKKRYNEQQITEVLKEAKAGDAGEGTMSSAWVWGGEFLRLAQQFCWSGGKGGEAGEGAGG